MGTERQSLQKTITTLHQEKEKLCKNHEARVALLEGELASLRQELERRGRGVEFVDSEHEQGREAREVAQGTLQQLEKVRQRFL